MYMYKPSGGSGEVLGVQATPTNYLITWLADFIKKRI